MRALTLALALLLGPAVAMAAPQDEEPAPVELTEEQVAEAWGPYEDALARGDRTRAADALLPVLDSPDLAPLHAEAWARLAGLLVDFDMEYSALLAYTRALELDPVASTAHVGTAMDLAESLGDEDVLGPVLAANVGLDVDKGTRSRMAYLAARTYFRDASYGTALGILLMVDAHSDRYADAQLLKGVILAQQGRFEDSLAPMLTAQAAQADDARFRDLVGINLGRAYFGAGNFPRAIEYYGKVSRESEFWPQAQFETAWAAFRLQDPNAALSLLMTHDSPFFDDWYAPEADLLRAYSLFLMCKFPDASTEIDEFIATYRPTLDTLDRELGGMSATDVWGEVRAYLDGRPTALPPSLLRRYTWEDRLHGVIRTVDQADDELARLENVAANPFAAAARDRLLERRAQLVESEGTRIKGHLEAARLELKGMFADVQVTKLDMMQFEASLYEQAAATGQLAEAERLNRLRRFRRSGARVWPFQGEYWADELGWYRIQAAPDCPASLTPGQEN